MAKVKTVKVSIYIELINKQSIVYSCETNNLIRRTIPIHLYTPEQDEKEIIQILKKMMTIKYGK